MNIGVLVKQALNVRSVQIDGKTGKPSFGEGPVMNSNDAHAVSEAVDLREATGGELTAVTLGPASACEVLVSALATGVDKAIHITEDEVEEGDALATARALAEVLKDRELDVIVAGTASDDFGPGQVGVQVAELLGLPHVSGVVNAVVEDGTLKVTHDVDGFPEEATVGTPVVLVYKQSDEGPKRHPSLRGMMQAKRKPVEEVANGVAMTSQLSWSDPAASRLSADRIMLEGEPAEEMAAKLAAWMREHRLVG